MELNGNEKLAGFEIQVISEGFEKAITITDHPVEEGFNISDHTEPKAQYITIQVNIVRPTFERAQKVVDDLEKKMMDAEKVSYQTGKKIYTNLLIESMALSRDSKINNGYSGTIELKKVRIAKQAYIPPKLNSQVKKTASSGRKQTQNKPAQKGHTIRKGETFWAIAPKYGTTWQELQKLNPGVDPRKLQIGQEVRVK
jgi:hypothetical protein